MSGAAQWASVPWAVWSQALQKHVVIPTRSTRAWSFSSSLWITVLGLCFSTGVSLYITQVVPWVGSPVSEMEGRLTWPGHVLVVRLEFSWTVAIRLLSLPCLRALRFPEGSLSLCSSPNSPLVRPSPPLAAGLWCRPSFCCGRGSIGPRLLV